MPVECRHPDRPVEPAATVMLVRDASPSGGVEVFVLRRTAGAVFAAGFYVFPGGRVDAGDAPAGGDPDGLCDGIDDATASAALGLEHGGAAFWVAAIRECFEEAGILLARRRDGGPLEVHQDDRRRVYDGSLSMHDLCRRDGLVLDAGALRYVAHWVTPAGESRRFDTRFFVAAAPAGQEGSHDESETVASRWVKPADALAEFEAGELWLLPPTVANLGFLASASCVADVMAAADAAGVPPRIEPRLAFDGSRVVGVTMPDGTTYTVPAAAR